MPLSDALSEPLDRSYNLDGIAKAKISRDNPRLKNKVENLPYSVSRLILMLL